MEINRLLERCLKESKCLDLESLCIVSEEKVRQTLHNNIGTYLGTGTVLVVRNITDLRTFLSPGSRWTRLKILSSLANYGIGTG